MRKIASFSPIWSQETFIGPHFELLKKLDHNLVSLQNGVLPSYREHGYLEKPDKSEEILHKYFPKVEIIQSKNDSSKDFGCELYNEGLRMLQDYDIVLRLDPDMIWTEKDFDTMINYMRTTNFDCYRMNFAKDSINYYMTWDYEHGLKNAQEFDPLAVSPKNMFTGIIDYTQENNTVMNFGDGWMCHHFRGWNKPKSTHKWWFIQPVAQRELINYGNKGKWFICPDTIKDRMEWWKKEIPLC